MTTTEFEPQKVLDTLQVILFRLEIPVELRAIIIKDYFLSWPISEYYVFTLNRFKQQLDLSVPYTNSKKEDCCHLNFSDGPYIHELYQALCLFSKKDRNAKKVEYRIGRRLVHVSISDDYDEQIPFYVIENVDCLTEEKIKQLYIDINKQFRYFTIKTFFDYC